MSLSDAALVASISQVILAGTIGVVTIYIAWQQWRTNRNQFRLHLFDRRIAVYDAVLDLSMRLAAKGTISKEELHQYATVIKVVSFIFDDKLQAYCDELFKKGGQLSMAYEVMQAPSAPSYQQMVELHRDLVLWFIEQIKELKPRFERFLRIRE
jgi:hypothetical protein